ncbi:MAG TPA: YSC84-related protein [Thermoanaerobaculia bacterium]|nr:YSC84-related protein [Thermoanaerobaculia bacterium]
MKLGRFALFGSVALTLGLAPGPLSAQEGKAPTDKTEAEWNAQKVEAKRSQIDATAGGALDKLLKENPAAKELYEKAYGWAAFDNLKLGFFFSGGGGKGVAVETKTKKRTYMEMGSVGFGLAFGGKKYEVVFLFQDSATFNAFVEKGWQAQGSANATAGKENAGGQTGFVNGMAIYQISGTGLMANVDLSGTKYFKDKSLN